MTSLVDRVIQTQDQQPDNQIQASRDDSSLRFDQFRLPVELLLQIISFVRGRANLIRLMLVSRMFKSIAEGILYRDIRIGTDQQIEQSTQSRRVMALCRSLKAPHIGDYVISFKIGLSGPQACSAELSGCQCDKLDAEFGAAITQLPNLRDLSFHCLLDSTIVTRQRHAWLARLRTRVLRALDVTCRCVQWYPVDLALLEAQCLNKLEALKLDLGTPSNTPAQEYYGVLEARLEPPRTIATLSHDISSPRTASIGMWFAANAAIRKLVIVGEGRDRAARRDQLTHIFKTKGVQLELLYSMNIESWLPTQDLTPYRSLVSLGSIRLLDCMVFKEVILHVTKRLSYLKRLRTIELSYDLYAEQYPPNWKDDLFTGLEMQFPLLTQVYLVDRSIPIPTDAFLYRKAEDGWKRHPARFLTFWDIAMGESFEPID
ncbi:hypothetical protein FRC17_003453 [Serendipita sp. 399]|nr:hypothetical protein FRC17_003453 [Serendipita sp. 399]